MSLIQECDCGCHSGTSHCVHCCNDGMHLCEDCMFYAAQDGGEDE